MGGVVEGFQPDPDYTSSTSLRLRMLLRIRLLGCVGSRKMAQKEWQASRVEGSLLHINAAPDERRKEAVADARRTLESAADFTRGGGPPAPDHDADYATRAGRVEAEQRLLIQWARENGILGAGGGLAPVFARSGKHEAFFQKRTKR